MLGKEAPYFSQDISFVAAPQVVICVSYADDMRGGDIMFEAIEPLPFFCFRSGVPRGDSGIALCSGRHTRKSL